MNAVLQAREPSARYLAAVQPALVRQFELLATAPGGVGRLRGLILALAIRGRLIPRNPIEGTRVTGATADDDGPFELPEGWLWKRLGSLQPEFQNGASSRGDAGGQPITVLRLADITDRRVSLADTREVPIRRQDIDKYLLRDGDILITRVNGSADIVGQFNLVEGELHAIYCDHFIRLRVSRDKLDPRYLALFGGSEVIRSRISNLFISTAGQKTVNQGHIGSLPIAIPPLAEQAHIVARVDELMRLCDALEAKGRLEAEQHARLLGTLLGTLTDSSTPEELAANWQRVANHFDLLLDRPEAVDALEQTILQLAVRGLLVSQSSSDQPASSLLEQIRTNGEQKKAQGRKLGGVASEVRLDEVPFELPESWAWSRFGQVAEIASDLVSPAAHGSAWQVAPDCIEKGTGRLLTKRTVADADVKSANHRFHPGQIIYSKIRPSLSKAVIVDFAGLCSADMYPINSKISIQYLLVAILSRCFLDQVAVAENRVKMPKLNQEALTAFLVPVPPLAEQERIVARVSELRRLCTDLRQRLTASQTTQSHLAEALVDSAAA